jgi:hypothetical protein
MKKTLVLVAGLALSMTGTAMAQGGGNYQSSGFTMSDASGDNSLTIGGAAILNYNMSFRDSDAVGDQEDFTQGFSDPLVRFRFGGHVGSKQFTYKMQITAAEFDDSSSDGDVEELTMSGFAADDVYGEWDMGNGWAFRWGQFNAPFSREVMNGAEARLGIGSSELAQYFGQGYSQGVMVMYGDEQMRFMGSWNDGVFSANSPFNTESADFGITLRLEGIVAGAGWDQFNNYTSWMSTQGDNVLVGGALHYEDGGETGGSSDQNIMGLTADAQWHGPGYGVAASFYYTQFESGSFEQKDFGINVQGSYFFNENIEGFARWDAFFLDNDVIVDPQDDQINIIALGVNCYPFQESNALRFTAQLGYSLNDTSALGAASENGFLGQNTDGEIAFGLSGRFIF